MKTVMERRQDALHKATTGQSFGNYPAIIQGFIGKGIPEAEIKPRENVFTFHAWRALNRTVRRNDCISDYLLPTDRVGMTFSDDMIPFILPDYSGSVELKYNDDAPYSKGEVVRGQREGEWTRWHPNGEVMQIANFKSGKYEGERLIREVTDGQYRKLIYK